jgi:hypothetical protein
MARRRGYFWDVRNDWKNSLGADPRVTKSDPLIAMASVFLSVNQPPSGNSHIFTYCFDC